MNKNNTAVRRILPLTLASLGALGGLQPAAADILLYDKDETTFSTDGYFNAFYVNSDVDRQGETYDRRQSRVKMGFLPNYIGFNFGRKVDELSLGGRASFWVTINDSETDGTDTAIDVRQFYGTVAGDWGEVLIGKDFGLFSRSNIFLDELLAGFGNPSDTLGLVDGKGVSFGNIGTGYPYPFPTSQITYRNNNLLPGLRIAVGILDPDRLQPDRQRCQRRPRRQGLPGQPALRERGQLPVRPGRGAGLQLDQRRLPDFEEHQRQRRQRDFQGVGYGLQVKMGGFSVTGSGFTAKGINPFFTNNAGEAALREVDSRGALLQGSYSWGKNRLALSYGKTVDDGNGLGSAADYESRGIAYFRTINDNLSWSPS